MTESTYFGIAIAMIIVGIIGTVLPAIPGLLLCFAGILAYKFLAAPDFSLFYVILFGILTLLSLIFEYYLPAKLSQKYGGSRFGSIGSIVGLWAGLILIPVPFGFLIGMALGTFLGEILKDSRNPKRALKATKGALIGFLVSSGAQLCLGLAMLAAVLFDWWS